ncbi:MAG: glutamine synthetase family protein [Rhizomicrobium sp.]
MFPLGPHAATLSASAAATANFTGNFIVFPALETDRKATAMPVPAQSRAAVSVGRRAGAAYDVPMNKATPLPAFARPAFVDAARAEFEAAVAAHPDIECVDAVVVDIAGTMRGKRLPLAEAARLFDTGMQLPRSVYLMDVKGEMVNPFDRGVGDGDPDGTAWPVPGTLSRVWGEGGKRLQLLATMRNEDGAPTGGEPRAALERVLERFADHRLTPVIALELEFYLIDRARDANGAPLPPLCPRSGRREKDNAVYSIDDLDRYAVFHAALGEAARLQGIPVSGASSEYAPGQFEINLHHQADARRAADHAVFLKQVVKAAARASGFEATFMAKPYPDRIGSGLHIHASILDADGRNIFDDGSAEGSERLRHAIAGLQALMPESMALFAPAINSYRRFEPDMFAPVNRRWGVNNRSAGLRVPVGRVRAAASSIAPPAPTPIPISRPPPCSRDCITGWSASSIPARRPPATSRASRTARCPSRWTTR